MGEKSAQKKSFILEKARQVFMDKGYKNVTMKDIVDACEISRGGLYLYFESTREVFLEVLALEKEEMDDTFNNSINEETSITDILGIFLKEQKKEILRRKNTLTVAIYEFFFENKVPKKENTVRQTFETAVKVLAELIDMGVNNGELYCEDSVGAARNIMFVLEGLKISAQTMSISEDIVDQQLLYIMAGLVIEEN